MSLERIPVIRLPKAPATAVAPHAAAPKRWTRRRIALAAAGGLLLALLLGGLLYAWAVREGYRNARASADVVQQRYTNPEVVSNLRPEDLPQISQDLGQLESDLKNLQGLVNAPLLGGLARHAPVVGDDVSASQDLLDLGVELASMAHEATDIANEIRMSFERTGMSAEGADGGPTWLDIVRERRPQIEALEARFDAALAARAALDTTNLPARGQALLPQVDSLLERAEGIRDDYISVLPLLDTAFGAEGEARYLILLQNREEIRPGGGFPGTFAVITLSDGLLKSYESANIREIDHAYVENRSAPVLAPAPIRTVIGQEEFLPHDTLWSPDFSEAAQTFLSMYNQTGEPPLTGVVGLSDSAVRQVLKIIGPYQLEINGEMRTVSADNYLELIESYRDQTWQDLAAHKHVVALLGKSLIDQVKAADIPTKKAVYFALRDAADSREVQVYLPDAAMQAEAVRRGWDGALYPDPSTPSLAMTVAGLTGGKKSLVIYAASDIALKQAAADLTVRWTITLDHRGDPRGNEVYNGYEYAWLSLYLPPGAEVLSTSRTPEGPELADDPRAVSFGVPLMPGTQESVTIEFRLAGAPDRLLLRRQSGFNDVAVRVSGTTAACPIDWSVTLTRDQVIDLQQCVVLPAR